MKKIQKGNVAVIAIIVILVAITAGVIGWMFAKKSAQIQTTQVSQVQQPIQPAIKTTLLTESSQTASQGVVYANELLGYQLTLPKGYGRIIKLIQKMDLQKLACQQMTQNIRLILTQKQEKNMLHSWKYSHGHLMLGI